MKTIISSAIVATILGAVPFSTSGNAHTIWRYGYKAVPYAVPHTHVLDGYVVQNPADCPRTAIRRSSHSAATLVCPDK